MAALTVNREDQARIKSLLTEAVTVLCRNGLSYSSHVAIDGLLGITVDDRDVFLVKLTENVSHSDSSADFSHVSELLGAAQNNFGLSLNADGSSPLPMHRFGGKDLNDNNCSTPAAINIAPLGDGVLSAPRSGKRGRGSSGHAGDQPTPKRSNMSESPITTPTSATSGGVGRIGEDAGGNLVIKSEPIDYDDETPAHQPYAGKTLGVISTVNTDNFNDSADDSYNGDQPSESQDGVLQALRAALIHKLANNGTPMTPKYNNNNNDSPSPTPSNNNNSSGGVKKRKTTPKNENQESEVTLKCLMCTYETNRRYNFIRHMRGHSKSYAIYACDLCGERFHSEDELGSHGLEAHKGHHLTCDQCGMTFMSERGKNIHAKTHKMMPIPEKKSVECETQCSQNDLEESMLNISSGAKVITSTGQSNDEAAASYRTLREQLSSRSLVIRFPVLNGRVQTAVVDGAMQDAGDQSKDEEDQPADLSLSKSCSTSTSPPPPFTPKEESSSPVAKTTAAMSSTATATKSLTTTATKPPAATTTKLPAATTTKSPAATTTKSPAATATKAPATTATKAPATTATKAPAATTTKAPVTLIRPSTTAAEHSPSTSKPTPHTTKVVSSVMNLSLPSSTIPCTTSTSRVLPTSALSTALANAVKAKSILISPPSASVSPTPSTSSTTESESKTKSRKQHSAQIVRLVTVKTEPTED